MYGFMAIAHFWLFGALLGITLEASMPEFWLMMQIAMLCGFLTAYPVNWWLVRRGIKEAM
jgi:ABC-type Mn2+/Zn2+ transport system permease subunit